MVSRLAEATCARDCSSASWKEGMPAVSKMPRIVMTMTNSMRVIARRNDLLTIFGTRFLSMISVIRCSLLVHLTGHFEHWQVNGQHQTGDGCAHAGNHNRLKQFGDFSDQR